MKISTFLIISIVLYACSSKPRTGLKKQNRNYDTKELSTKDCPDLPTDGIYLFKDNIHDKIMKSMEILCDSVLGLGFVSKDVYSVILDELRCKTLAFVDDNPTMLIDSKNLQGSLIENKGGWASLEFRESQLINDTPLKINVNNLLLHEELPTLNESTGEFDIIIIAALCMDTIMEKKGIYTLSDLTNNKKEPVYKYHGKCNINLRMLVTKKNDNKTEYYQKNIVTNFDHYTSMQFLPIDGVVIK